MTSKKTSDTGAYMSKYDQEVEIRLQKLETSIQKIEENVEKKNSVPVVPAPVSSDLEEKLNLLIDILKNSSGLNIEKRSKGKL